MSVVINGTSGITGNSGTLLSNSTVGVGAATPAASGAGITFPATASASSDANTLDDYEEGTWTPTIIGTSTAGTASYSGQVGKYTKIGNVVVCTMLIDYTGGTGSGGLRINGLPFTSANDSTYAVASLYYSNIAFTSGWAPQAYVGLNTTYINCEQSNGGASANITYDAAGVIVGSVTYRT